MNRNLICPICGSAGYKELDFGGYVYSHRVFPLVECSGCLLKYISHNLTDNEISSFYNNDKYFESEYAGGTNKNYTDNELGQVSKASYVLKKIDKYRNNNSNRLLEIGCAGGYFLKTAQGEFGYSVVGVEMSKTMSDLAKNKNLEVYQGSIDNLPSTVDNFDLIYMGDVLEHMSEPNDFISKIKKKLNYDGLIILELPLTYNITMFGVVAWLANLLKGKIGCKYLLPAQHRGYLIKKPPYHLIMFNRRSIKKYLSLNNMQLKYIKVYEGYPKRKFNNMFLYFIKLLTHYLTIIFNQKIFGDRAIVIAQKNEDTLLFR